MLELCPPILDPKELVPPHLIEKFRQEFREQQAAKQAATSELQHAEVVERLAQVKVDSPARPSAKEELHVGSPLDLPADERPTLEEWRESRGLAAKAPPAPTGLETLTHGANRDRTFKQYPGAQSSLAEAETLSPSRKRGYAGARAAQSSLGVGLQIDR